MQKMQDLRAACCVLAGMRGTKVYLPAEHDVDRSQRQGKPSHVRLVDFFNHEVSLKEVDNRVHKSHSRGNRSEQRRFPFRLKSNQRRYRKNGKEQRGKKESQTELRPTVKARVPSDVEQKRSSVAHDQETAPGLEYDQEQRRYIEQQHVGKESNFAVLSRR